MFGELLTKGLPKNKACEVRISIGVSSLMEQEEVYVEESHDKDASTSSG
jgi:hypothetical protein